jgi:hypothetical protein
VSGADGDWEGACLFDVYHAWFKKLVLRAGSGLGAGAGLVSGLGGYG